MTRVIVVGGGPAGSLLAYHLARSGVETLVLERARFPRDKACGEFLNPLGVRCLRNAGFLNAVLASGAEWIDRARVVLPSGKGVESPIAIGERSGKGLSLPRRTLDALLLDRAEAAGAEVRQGFRVNDIRREGTQGRWRVAGRDLTHGPESYTCDLIVGADGAASVVARRMGWLRPAWPRRMGVTAGFHEMKAEPGVIEMHMLPGAYCGVVHQADGVAHVGLAFDHAGGDFLNGSSLEYFLVHSLGRFPGIRDRLEGAELAGPAKAFGPMAVRSRKRAGDGVLLVGDAAGFLDPVTGHGIGYAMRSAELAAETLREALNNGDVSERSLSAYSRAYWREFGPQLRLYGGLQRVLALPAPALHPLARLMEAWPGMLERLIPLFVSGEGEKEAARPNQCNLSKREPKRLLRDP